MVFYELVDHGLFVNLQIMAFYELVDHGLL